MGKARMIDINLIRENPEKVKEGVKAKGYDVSLVDRVLELDKKRAGLIKRVEELRQERNKLSKSSGDRSEGVNVKEELKKLEPELKKVAGEYEVVLQEIPNLPPESVPVGKDESGNKELQTQGEKPKFGFKPKDHLALGESLDVLDFENASKVAGSGFYYLKNDGVLLELALLRHGIDFLAGKGFTPFATPELARERFYVGTGYLPKGKEAQTYVIEDQDLGLIATSEVTLAGLHADEVIDKLPRKYAGISHCFRVEAGGYGKYSKGLYRVHQFSKVEMFAYSIAEESKKMFDELLSLQKEFWKSLGIAYRIIEMCTGDLGAQAARKVDLEVWMPGRGEWGEVTSLSNTTDYQARNLNIKYQKSGKSEYAHTVNGTLVAVPRAIIAILENFQQKDGSVAIPEALCPYMGKDKITS